MSVNLDFVHKWCEALESGKYAQTEGSMKNFRAPRSQVDPSMYEPGPIECYCCLGVGLLVARDMNVLPDDIVVSTTQDMMIVSRYGDSWRAAWGPFVEKALGFNHNLVKDLIAMNDGRKQTFRQIAARLRNEFHIPLAVSQNGTIPAGPNEISKLMEAELPGASKDGQKPSMDDTSGE